MSHPPSALPGDVFDLLVTTCIWEKWLGNDYHAQPTFAAPVTKTCFREAHSMLQTGVEESRTAEIWADDPDFDLYFDGDDPDAQGFSLNDRFTPGGVGDPTYNKLQPSAVNTVLGPWGNNCWVVVVAF